MPSKVAKVNMDGTNPEILTRDIEHPEAITIDLDKKILYYSMRYPGYVSISLEVDRTDLLRGKRLKNLNYFRSRR